MFSKISTKIHKRDLWKRQNTLKKWGAPCRFQDYINHINYLEGHQPYPNSQLLIRKANNHKADDIQSGVKRKRSEGTKVSLQHVMPYQRSTHDHEHHDKPLSECQYSKVIWVNPQVNPLKFHLHTSPHSFSRFSFNVKLFLQRFKTSWNFWKTKVE